MCVRINSKFHPNFHAIFAHSSNRLCECVHCVYLAYLLARLIRDDVDGARGRRAGPLPVSTARPLSRAYSLEAQCTTKTIIDQPRCIGYQSIS